jgi:hypothetical protein
MHEDPVAPPEMPYVSYHRASDGYHVLTFFESSRRAIDHWVVHLTHIMEVSEGAPCICIMYDVRRSGLLPMLYMAEKSKELIAAFPICPPLRVAGVYENQLFFRLVDKFVDLVTSRQRDKIVFFKASEIDSASVWLCEELAAHHSQTADV